MAPMSAHLISVCGTLKAPESITTMSTSRNSSSPANDDPSDRGSEDDTISSTEYALRCREFLQFLKDLNNLGTDKYFDMPRITVIGGQSAGKSSLVEAVSGINVPRDSGTCTRCPMECSMSSNADAWSCQITLRYSVDGNGRNLAIPERALFGPPIRDKESMELWLRRAQAAILSPHMEHGDFHDKTLEDLQEAMRTDLNVLPFSKNVIQVEVEDPDLTDLSFIDLPGLIQNSDANIINLVRELVESHISGQNTLILVAIPMSDDMENQQAVRLAKEADPSGERTIGVLTKPDTLPPGASGSRKRWADIIEGRQHPLKHGYYCVRLPDDDERARRISRTESTKIAMEFFKSTPPWNKISRHRFGVHNLISDLSLILVGLIEKNLPALKNTIDEQLRTCHDSLSELPTPLTTDPSTEFLLRVTKFCTDFHSAVLGEDHRTLVQHNRQQYSQLKSDIYRTCPDFRPFGDSTTYHDPNLEGPAGYSRPPLDLEDVQKVINDSIGWELPGYVPFHATAKLILEITEQWKTPSHACFKNVFDSSSHFVDELATRHFHRFKALEAHVKSVVHIELEKLNASALQAVDKALQLERYPVYTQNTDFFATEKRKWSELYTDVRRRPWLYPINTANASDVSDDGKDEVVAGDTFQFEQALSVMANVRAFFEVIYKRIVDSIPLVIEHEFLQIAMTNFRASLFESLPKGHDASERTKALLSEDPVVARERSSLEGKRDRLTQIKLRLDEFHRKVGRLLGS